MVQYGEDDVRAYRIGFAGEFWLQESAERKDYADAQDNIRNVQMSIGNVKNKFQHYESDYERLKAESTWAD